MSYRLINFYSSFYLCKYTFKLDVLELFGTAIYLSNMKLNAKFYETETMTWIRRVRLVLNLFLNTDIFFPHYIKTSLAEFEVSNAFSGV